MAFNVDWFNERNNYIRNSNDRNRLIRNNAISNVNHKPIQNDPVFRALNSHMFKK